MRSIQLTKKDKNGQCVDQKTQKAESMIDKTEENVAVQACYSIEKQETFDREVSQLVRLNEKENGKYKLYIVTKEDKRELFVKGNKIEVISLTDFLLGRK